MRYLLPIVLILISVICNAQGILPVGSCVNNHAASCNPASNEIGNRSTGYTTDETIPENQFKCLSYTADCSGTLGYAYIQHRGTDTDNVKVCVYSDVGSVANEPDDTDTLLVCSGVITSSTDNEMAQSSGKLGESVTNGASYLLCAVSDATAWAFDFQTSGTKSIFYDILSYTTPPANLTANGDWTEVTTNEVSMYVEIE